MSDVSIGLAQDLMVDQLIINFRVLNNRRGYAKYTNKFHIGLGVDLLTTKWGLELYKVKCNL